MEYLAHYNKNIGSKQTLRKHLETVGRSSSELVKQSIYFEGFSYKDLKDVVNHMGIFHDFGKYMDYFQQYLKEDKKSKYRNHSHISACVFYKLLSQKYTGDIKNYKNLCINFLAYVSIRLHHGDLTTDFDLKDSSQWKYLKKQQGNLLGNKDKIYKDISEILPIDKKEFNNILYIDGLKEETFFTAMPHLFKKRFQSNQWFFILVYIFSLLIDADKLDSAGIDRNIQKKKESKLVENYINAISSKKKLSINKLRDQARKEILSSIENLKESNIRDSGIFTLTAPTGIGKTLSSLQAALLLGEKIKNIYAYEPKIITAIPFINIIEQTKSNYEDIFKDVTEVLEHHQFTDISKVSSNKEQSLDKKLLQVESWESEVILTTFVQFFHSIFTNRGSALKKLNKIAGSIIILDEIQSIPDKYLPLVGATIYKISKHYGSKFILMTATKPKIIEYGNQLLKDDNEKIESVELLHNNEKYFKYFNRTKLIPILDNEIDSEGFIELVKNKRNEDNTTLIVVNTIKRSLSLYNTLNQDIDIDCKILYLSTNIIPIHRKEVINKAKEYIKNKVPFILVSTQTVEAGVDLDFDMGFRDLGPLASIIQVAGRINRGNKGKEPKPLYIVNLENDNKHVYKMNHIYYTKEFLKGYEEIREDMYYELIDNYYNNLLKEGVSDESRDIWEKGIKKLDFSEIIKFQLIEQMGNIIDLFIEYDEYASNLADKYEKIYTIFIEEKDKSKRFNYKVQLKQISKEMRRYMVSIRLTKLMDNPPIEFKERNGVEAPFYWVPNVEKDRYYDDETGYIYENDSALLF